MVTELKGGTTMKMKKMVGALALSAALAMGTAPAFAASVDDDGTANEFSDNGSTTVKAKVDTVIENVRATVPLQVTVVFGSQGEVEIQGPSDKSYAITNVGTGPIYVANAEITDMNNFFASEAWKSGVTPSDKAMMLFYSTDGDSGVDTYLTTGHNLLAAKTGNSGPGKTEKELLTTWGKTAVNYEGNEDIIPADNGKLHITLGGMAYFADQISADDFSDTLCKIKYTIAPFEE